MVTIVQISRSIRESGIGEGCTVSKHRGVLGPGRVPVQGQIVPVRSSCPVHRIDVHTDLPSFHILPRRPGTNETYMKRINLIETQSQLCPDTNVD